MNVLPLWFLILSIFLPRISLILGYFTDTLAPYGLSGWMPPALTVLLPRILVLILIFQDRGFSFWLVVHGSAMALTYMAAGSKSAR